MRHPLFVVVFASALVLPGCAGLRLPLPFTGERGISRGVTLEDLRIELGAYANRFGAAVATAAGEISDRAPSRPVRRRALLWQLRMAPLVEQSAYRPDPREGYLAVLTIASMQRAYLEDGDGRALFGDDQPIAVDAARTLEEDAIGIGRGFLTASELARVTAEVEGLVARYPMQGREFAYQYGVDVREGLRKSESLASVLTLPLAPFRALQGVDSGAQAIHEFNQTARHFSDVVARMPAQVRGEAELLLYDAEDRETVQQLVAAAAQVAAAATLVSESAARLPQDLRAALAQAEGPLAGTREVLGQAQALAGPLDDVSEKLRLASADWRAVLGDREARERSHEPGDRSFDVREWESAARATGEAAERLDRLAGSLAALAGSEGPGALVDRAAWRTAQLLVLLFALLLLFRWLAARIARRAPDAA